MQSPTILLKPQKTLESAIPLRHTVDPIIKLTQVTKRYGPVTAVKDLTLDIEEGEVFGLLGPNGAGKTTTIEMLEGLREPDGGQIRVAGLDPMHEGDQLKELIGVQLEMTPLYQILTVKEILYHFSRYYRTRVSLQEVIARMNLEEKETSRIHTLSKGQRQRLALGLALINNPMILFLDEPTSGLDPQGRRSIWEIIDGVRGKKTVLLTTHHMEEAEILCDRVGIIDHGRLIALGTPRELISRYLAESRIELTCPQGNGLSFLAEIAQVDRIIKQNETTYIYSDDSYATLHAIIHHLQQSHIQMDYLAIRKGSLEDVFLTLTGRSIRD